MTNVIDRKELIKKLKETFEKMVEQRLDRDDRLDKIKKENLTLRLEDKDFLNQFSEFTDSLIQNIVQENENRLELTEEKRKRILARASDYDDYYENITDDELLYGLKDH